MYDDGVHHSVFVLEPTILIFTLLLCDQGHFEPVDTRYLSPLQNLLKQNKNPVYNE